MHGGKILDKIEMILRDIRSDDKISVWIDVFDSSLSRKWLSALNILLLDQYHLEKNYCFMGFANGRRSGAMILERVNQSIDAINQASLGYEINDSFSLENTLTMGPVGDGLPGRRIRHEKFNRLHRYFEDLQGVSGNLSEFFHLADPTTRWHIRQLNLLCHEFESWALSYRKQAYAPEWQRPSQLMCWLHAPRFVIDNEDLKLFGIDTLNRSLGGVYVGVNKAVGKHHWEVFQDEGRDSRIDELTTSTLRSQTEAAGDFDIEWGNNPGSFPWQKRTLTAFRQWLQHNGFDPEDPSLTIGHPRIGQIDLVRSFGTADYDIIWSKIENHMDVIEVRTGNCRATYDYHWSDRDFVDRQIEIIKKGKHHEMATQNY